MNDPYRTTADPLRQSEKNEWEKVCQDTYRLYVPGGWLYRFDSKVVVEKNYHSVFETVGSSICFVPMPENK